MIAEEIKKRDEQEESLKRRGKKVPWLKSNGGQKSSLEKKDGGNTKKQKVKFDSASSTKDIPCRYFKAPGGLHERGIVPI